MLDSLNIMRLAHGLAAHASERQSVIAKNIANADTPGFEARDLTPFQAEMAAQSSQMKATRPGHIGGSDGMQAEASLIKVGTEQSPNGNTVSLETEMLRAVDARRSHDLALTVYRNSLDILRAAVRVR